MKAVVGNLAGIQIEGNLIAPDMTAELQSGELKGQTPEDFGLAKNTKLADEIATAWGDAKAYWVAFTRSLSRLDEKDSATSITREQWVVPLLRSLGYAPVYTAKAEVLEGQTFAISHRADAGANRPPIHTVGCRVKLEERPPSGTPRLSAHALMQEYLNRTEHLWGIVTNGLRWRLLRDSSLMTRLSYIEFDLEQILNGENFAEFGLFYRLFHRSRLPQGMDDADTCLLEVYHQAAVEQGGRVRDRLRDGVEQALVQLGTGLLQHPSSQALRQRFESGELTDSAYYRQLLQLIYRLLFLMVAESRNLLLTENDPEKARIYQEYYSVQRLRDLAQYPSWRREGFQDLWQRLRVTFCLFDENWRGQLLGLSPLNGDLFCTATLRDLDKCAIDNHDLLLAVRQLSLYEQKGQLRRVNYGALDVEELGSIYESLLDFHPQVTQRQGIYEFQLVVGSDRKTTGSYYTPPELVGQLIKSALEPVIEAKLQGLETKEQQEAALLSLKTCDPACGSGHFLLAAARRIGKELARVRTGEAQPGPEPLRQATRDVIQHCIYGVDLNPLAVDLCKVALWIEGFNHGLPLSFLDHRIKCGNSLVGVLDLDCLNEGIPDEAFKAVTGDDKALSASVRKSNKSQRKDLEIGQLSLGFENLDEERSHYAPAWRGLGAIADNQPQDIKQKEATYKQNRRDPAWWRDYSACNLWTAAFFTPLTEQNLKLLPTTAALTQLLRGNLSTQKTVEAANKLAQEKHFFHWPLEFPEVFEQGGFNCALGNPPWEQLQLDPREFFIIRSPGIKEATNMAARDRMITELKNDDQSLYAEFEEAKHDVDAFQKFIHSSSRFLLTSFGRINLAPLFAELAKKLLSSEGRTGIIVPTGIATDSFNQYFFADLVRSQSLASLYDFENREALFTAVHRSYKFSLLSISGKPIKQGDFAFFSTQVKHLDNQSRVFHLSPEDIALLNPNTFTCPVFHTRTDAELTKKIYRHIPILVNEEMSRNPWDVSFMLMFMMNTDSNLFSTEYHPGLVPLFEGKMVQAFNHRAASSVTNVQNSKRSGQPVETLLEEYLDPNYLPHPQYWVKEKDVQARLPQSLSWFIGFKSVTSSTNERTFIATFLPFCGVGNSMPLILGHYFKKTLACCFVSNLNSVVFDFVAKQKVGGVNLNFFIVKQLPVIPPEAYSLSGAEKS